MGKASRPRPKDLPKKLLRVRKRLGLSQNGMIRRLGFEKELTQDYISAYERGIREPPLPVLLRYARVAGVLMEVLVDDELDLPARSRPTTKRETLPRQKRTTKRKS